MLGRAHRLRSRADFGKIHQRGRAAHGRYIMVKAQLNHKPESRFGVVVSKKISKRAVARNRIHRRIVAILRQSIELNQGWDYVIMAKPAIAEASPEALKQDIIKTLAQFEGGQSRS